MRAHSPEYRSSIIQILELARTHVGMDVAWVSRWRDDHEVFQTVVQATPGAGPPDASEQPLSDSYCVRVLDGRLPSVVPDARSDPRTRTLQTTHDLNIGSYVGVPIRSEDGLVEGMLCCIANSPNWAVDQDQVLFLQRLADAIAVLGLDRQSKWGVELDLPSTWRRLKYAIAGQGLQAAVQPVYDVRSGRMVAAEALARFDGPNPRPDVWFFDAEQVGLRTELEIAAMQAALVWLRDLPLDVALAINASPVLLTSGALEHVLRDVDVSRVVLEITEHTVVNDYVEVERALRRHRQAGLRLSIDDAGAGYASFRHILELKPDIVKIDVSLIRGIDHDAVRRALVASLVAFTGATRAELIAEGVETPEELLVLRELGVGFAQGFLLARPTTDRDEVARLTHPPSVLAASP